MCDIGEMRRETRDTVVKRERDFQDNDLLGNERVYVRGDKR